MRRALLLLGCAVAATAGVATAGAAPPAKRSFSGSCSLYGPISPMPPITVVPRPGAHFSYRGTGSCTGTLDGRAIAKAPLILTFTDVGTLFDTCELGPDFDLHGTLMLSAPRRPTRFAIRLDLARLLLGGPFVLQAGGGRALGSASFKPANANAAPQQCAGGGVADASLSASFSTVSPLVGTAVPPPRPPTHRAHRSRRSRRHRR